MSDDKDRSSAISVDVLREIATPLKYFALAILVVDGILGGLALKASGSDFTLLVGGMVGSLVLLIVVVGYLVARRPEALLGFGHKGIPKISTKHDVFLSSPMAAYGNEEEYQRDRQHVLAIIAELKKECRFDSIVYAGRDIQSMADFDAADLSVGTDFKALLESKYFLMLYPKKIASSVLVEAGWALALGKVSLYFVSDRDDLPFLLKQAEQAFASVKIYDKCTPESIVKLIRRHRNDLFLTRTTEAAGGGDNEP